MPEKKRFRFIMIGCEFTTNMVAEELDGFLNDPDAQWLKITDETTGRSMSINQDNVLLIEEVEESK